MRGPQQTWNLVDHWGLPVLSSDVKEYVFINYSIEYTVFYVQYYNYPENRKFLPWVIILRSSKYHWFFLFQTQCIGQYYTIKAVDSFWHCSSSNKVDSMHMYQVENNCDCMAIKGYA